MLKISETVDHARQTQAFATRLGYAGLIPFAVGAILVWARPGFLPMGFLGDAVLAVLFYGALILSFMGGAEWGSALRTGRYERLAVAVLWSLIGWLAVLPAGLLPGFAPSTPARYLILFCAFTGLIITELLALEWDGWYQRLRIKLSIGTIGLLFLTIVGLIY